MLYNWLLLPWPKTPADGLLALIGAIIFLYATTQLALAHHHFHRLRRAMKPATSRKAVAPVLATLLMIAVAVSMSVIIFMWSQGFLSQTSESTGAQQGAQNQAAQSSIAIEAVLFDTTNKNATVVVRNVGAVAVKLGNIVMSGVSSNAGFKGSQIKDASGTQLSKGQATSIEVTGLTNLTSGDVVTVKATTEAGTFAQASYTVP
jgi:FlaG/FlaF family flagellin (archaellin)